MITKAKSFTIAFVLFMVALLLILVMFGELGFHCDCGPFSVR